jgi:hypothetical protein
VNKIHDSRKKFIKNIFFFLLVAIILFLTATVIANYFDYKVGFLDINPPDKHTDKYIDLYYPPSSQIPIVEKLPSGDIVNLPLFTVHILLRYNGTLTEGSKVDIIAKGYAYPEGQKLLSAPIGLNRNTKLENQPIEMKYIVLAGFEGSSKNYDESSAIMPFSRGEFLVFMEDYNNTAIHRLFRLKDYDVVPPVQSITWDTQGDYSPYITFVSSNRTIITAQYPDYKIHVSGSEVVKQERYARISVLLAIVLFFFTLIQSISYLCKLNPELISKLLGDQVEIKKTDDTISNQNQPASESKQPSPDKPQRSGGKFKSKK